MIRCPYCQTDFPEAYYNRTHVPCPEDRADEARRSFLAQGVLYCSEACARKACKVGGRSLDPEEFNAQEHGALCPVCETTYPEY